MNIAQPSRRSSHGWLVVWLLLPALPCAAQGELVSASRIESPWRASCATSTCHGGIEGIGPAWNHAASIWTTRDPHARAGRLLRDSDSKAIVVRLVAQAADDAIVYDNVLRTRCVSCHTSATTEDCQPIGMLAENLLNQGVHCQSCHGSAVAWLEPHLSRDWSGPERFAPSTGMRDTESIVGRASTCVRCHIGSRREDGLIRDMNHDLIAAGHPALRFDLLIYNDNLPKHWGTDNETEQTFNQSAVRVRQVSRAVNLAAAASLSAERALDHLQDRSAAPWPELSDYDCFACHQSLSMREYLLPPGRTGEANSPFAVSAGLPVWNSWHTISNELEIRGNRKALEAFSPLHSPPAQMAALTQQIAERFRDKATQRSAASLTASDIAQTAQQSIDSLREELQRSAPIDWHQAAIEYLDLEAAARDLSQSASTGSQAQRRLESLSAIEQLLRFEPADSDRSGGRLHSPAEFDPGVFRSKLLKLLEDWTADRAQTDQNATNPPASVAQET